MPVRIFNNIASLNAQRILGQNNDRLAKSVERIASGIRINRGAFRYVDEGNSVVGVSDTLPKCPDVGAQGF